MVEPWGVVPKHGVEGGEKFAHDRDDHDFEGFAMVGQTLGKELERAVAVFGGERRHIEHVSYAGAAAEDEGLSDMIAGFIIPGR